VPWQVVDLQVTAANATTTTVEEGMQQLSLDDTPTKEERDLWKVVDSWSPARRLGRITAQTQIIFADQDTDETGRTPSSVPPPQRFVVGLDHELQATLQILRAPLARAHLFASRSVRPPRGVLLHGASGVGKSALARQVANALQQLHPTVEVCRLNCSTLQSQLAVVGEAEQSLSRAFGRHSPRLLILDDIHLICPRRGSDAPAGTDQLASTLLSLMDGIGERDEEEVVSTRPLMVLAITSDPSQLDPALRRPGRLDTEIEIPLPDEAATRAAILQFHGAKMMDANDDDTFISEESWLALGKLAKGFNGSDCMLAIKEASRAATLRSLQSSMENDKPRLTFEDLAMGIRHTKPSSIKAVTVEIPQVKWSDIGGMDEVKRDLREAIEQPLMKSDLYAKLRLPSPRGILLYGPPGCSKTLMARALATEGHMNFLAVKGPELLSKWLGESERALASLFRRARMASPCIIFFDEMDAIAAKRGTGDSASSSRLLSQLLTELDGVSAGQGSSSSNSKSSKAAPRVVVVGATNRPDLLDTALTRPGRMDRMIYVGPPDQASRERIFTLGLKGRPCDETLNMAFLAEQSQGFSGAEIIAICRDAALLALEEDEEQQQQLTSMEEATASSPVVTSALVETSIASMNRQITRDMLDFYDDFRNHRLP
jgi:SpoVK/Ycf46/Vps4 family AAA+-type ATPase